MKKPDGKTPENEFRQNSNLSETALGNGQKIPTVSEWKNREIARKSIVAAGPIKMGDLFTTDNIAIKRPGNGLSPTTYWTILGGTAPKDYDTDEMITEQSHIS